MLSQNESNENPNQNLIDPSLNQHQQKFPLNVNIEIDSALLQSSNYQQTYFKCFGKTRRLPDKDGICGITLSICLFFIGTTLYELMCFSIVTSKDENNNFSKTTYLISAILGLITFIISQISYFDITTSIPGYQQSNKLSLEEYKRSPPKQLIKGVEFTLKYCPTCKIARNIRTFHCRYCNMCIERHDHHCGYVSNCIGKDNMKKFFYFLCTTALHCFIITIVSLYTWVHSILKENNSQSTPSLYSFSMYAIFGGCLAVYVGIFLLMVLIMICKHIVMFMQNETTNETLRRKYDNKVFNQGISNNCKEVFCNKETDFDPEEWKRSINSINNYNGNMNVV